MDLLAENIQYSNLCYVLYFLAIKMYVFLFLHPIPGLTGFDSIALCKCKHVVRWITST